jgi:dihydroorotate dehydrogenase
MEWLAVVRTDDSLSQEQFSVGAGRADGLMVDGSIADGAGRLHGKPSQRAALECLRNLRRLVGERTLIIASGGIHQPADAVQFLDAGATLLQIDTGMVFSGPGLCKRINEALLWRDAPSPSRQVPDRSFRPTEHSWFWTALLGLAMLIGSVLALIIASHRIVLPYDEAFCGWSREQMRQFNPRLLSFLAHDRVTLAGTMVSIGILYLSLSWHGARRGLHWARMCVLVSAGTGFFSFFLFLGFGYFDPFHGFVTAVLFQLFAMGVHAKEMPRGRFELPEWNETRAWRWGQWGQLLLVIHSVGLLGAGTLIASIGVRDVLVAEDLNYLGTTLEFLRGANPKVIPLVAHDRATLGGMLIAAGLTYLLASLWGFRRGAVWLWHSFLWSGLAAYAAAIGVHYVVGYVDIGHLLPAYAGLGLLLSGLLCIYPWCRERDGSVSPESRQTVG